MNNIQNNKPKIISYIILLIFIPNITFAKIDESLIMTIENYLNSITTIKANFTQVSNDGEIQTGVFYLSKPEKLRWEYKKPKKMLIVSNENLSMVYDEELEETYFCQENCGPKYFLSKNKINLKKDIKIISLTKSTDGINLTFTDPKDKTHKIISMKFNTSPIQIKSINIKEEETIDININLSNIVTGVILKNELFSCTDPKFLKQKF